MIWFFLAGMIAGAVGWHKVLRVFGEWIEQQRKIDELNGQKKEETADDGDGV